MSTENLNQDLTNDTNLNEEIVQIIPEIIPSMDDFQDEINKSFKKLREGDMVTGTIIGISETEVSLDLGSYAEGIIPVSELSNDPNYLVNDELSLNDSISAIVIKEDDGNGNILLSKKQADNILAWDLLTELKNKNQMTHIKVAQAVNGGVITYLHGIRGFIPASQLSLNYVEDLNEYVGKNLDVLVMTVEKEDRRLILSAKEVELKKQIEDRHSKISKLQVGIVTNGIVESIVPYGAFIKLDDGLSGLVHISQIAGRRLKSPSEVLKEGQEVNVKIIAIKDGKISLSIKDVESNEDVIEDVEDIASSFSSGERVVTGLGDLLKNIKL